MALKGILRATHKDADYELLIRIKGSKKGADDEILIRI